jgi:hypothetical protein
MIKRVLVLAAGAVLLTACDPGGSAARTTSPGPTTEVTRNVAAGDLEPVNCGEVDVDGATHSLITEPTATGLVGCTEAFNVIDEFLAIPIQRRGATLDSIQLTNDWSCTTDDGETALIYCVQGLDELTFRTEPSAVPTDTEPVTCGEIDVDGTTHILVAQPAATGTVGCTEAFNVIDEYLNIPAERRLATLDSIQLTDNWSCTTDDGETTTIGCVKGDRVEDDYAFAFHTEPV